MWGLIGVIMSALFEFFVKIAKKTNFAFHGALLNNFLGVVGALE